LIFLAGIVVAVGSFVQGGVGFGFALIATPLLALIDPALVPVPLLLVSSVHAVLALARERGDTDWPGVGWSLLGRLPGTAAGALAVALLPVKVFTAVVAVTVLVCVGLAVSRWHPRRTVAALLVAGAVSGIGGTAASLGGPPLALLYAGESGSRVRATLAAYFTAGSVVSIGALAAAGQITPDRVVAGLVLLPFTLVGFVVSGPARRLLDGGWVRPLVVVLAGGSALALLARAALS
jgi:uncharacterized protein